MDNLKGLNTFSRRLLKALLRRHPDWAQFAQVGGIYLARQDPVEAGTLLLRVPRPCGPSEEYLEVSTAAWDRGPEVTVQFGGTHNHWDPWFPPKAPGVEQGDEHSENALITGVIGLIEEIVDEQVVVLCTLKDGRISSGGFVSPSGLDPAWRFAIGRPCRIRSWKGTYDAERVLTAEDIDPTLHPKP